MILVERSGRVGVPIESVWEVVQQAEQLPSWLAGVRQAEVLSGEGYGRRQRVQARRGASGEAEVIAYQEPTLIGWRERAKGAGARAEARTEVYVQLAADGDETGVRLIVVRWPAGPVSKALLRLGVRRVGAGLEGSLARLTELLMPAEVGARPAGDPGVLVGATVGGPSMAGADLGDQSAIEERRAPVGETRLDDLLRGPADESADEEAGVGGHRAAARVVASAKAKC
ncbi:hypothetical protein GCM10027280_33140 [Micromonospora polyrhachis]|uniref:Uncharacterized protein YndB with AHSA1/START domain n=1 Tax=Micromonospora polyrhachis TaxID=1282883 RepID=A0A7W7STW0_9ACTN|nr:uncharacterized protein YndB with AHSA1/START domain [Micromonospora polyrhachis]